MSLGDLEGYSPAREIIGAMMRWHEDIDGNDVEQFQSAAFDAGRAIFGATRRFRPAADHGKSVPLINFIGVRSLAGGDLGYPFGA